MIGTIRKHSKTLWWIIIVAIIVTFVFWSSQSSRNPGGGSGGRSLGRLNGQPITPNSYEDAKREVLLMYYFMSGSFPDRGRPVSGFDLEQQTYVWLFMIKKQAEMGIVVTDDVAAKAASEHLRAINRGTPLPPDVFLKRILAPEGLNMQDFERYLRHEIGRQQLASVLGLGGELVTPQEVRALYTRQYQEVQTQVAFFSASNYLASIAPTTESISNFFTQKLPNYRLPERIQVNYLRFPLSNHLAEAVQRVNENTNLNELLEAVYQQRGGTNFYTEVKSAEEAKQQILKEIQENQALELARRDAAEFATMLYTNEPMRPENLVSLAKAQNLVPLVTPPFSREEPPAGLAVQAEFIRAAFALTDEEPFSQMLKGDDGVYVISLSKRLPSEIPSLETIRDKVMQDYRFNEAVTMARKAALDFAATATNVTSLPAFTAACTIAKVKPVTLPPLSISTRKLEQVENHVSLAQFKQAVFTTPVGQMSQLQPSIDGAYVVFVQGKLPLDEAKLAQNLPAFERSVRQTRQSEAFTEWFNREFNKVTAEIPYFAQKAQMSAAPAQ